MSDGTGIGQEHSLSIQKLQEADRPSIIAAGMAVAHALKEMGTCTMVVDALGRVIVLPPSKVKILTRVLVPDSALNLLSEDEAISVMIKEGRNDAEMMTYLKNRSQE